MAAVRVIPNELGLRQLLSSPTGGVARALARKAIQVESLAKVIATEEGLVDTGRYRASIAWRLGRDGLGLYADIGSNVDYARYLEQGTPPHEIRPVSKRALFWKGAEHPYARVRHPGTRAYRVLARALQRAI